VLEKIFQKTDYRVVLEGGGESFQHFHIAKSKFCCVVLLSIIHYALPYRNEIFFWRRGGSSYNQNIGKLGKKKQESGKKFDF